MKDGKWLLSILGLMGGLVIFWLCLDFYKQKTLGSPPPCPKKN